MSYEIEHISEKMIRLHPAIVHTHPRQTLMQHISPALLNEMQAWCVEHECGKRMSYDMFGFKNEKQKTMFLIRWGR
jgi:hypothetical protein